MELDKTIEIVFPNLFLQEVQCFQLHQSTHLRKSVEQSFIKVVRDSPSILHLSQHIAHGVP